VSALLLDDALKPATPLTNGAINENQLIFELRRTKIMPSFWTTLMYLQYVTVTLDNN